MVYPALTCGISVSMLPLEVLETFRTEQVCHRVVDVGFIRGASFGRDGQQQRGSSLYIVTDFKWC